MKPTGSRDLFVRDDGPGAAAAPAGPEPTARPARAGSAPARKCTLAVLAAAGAAAAALWAGTAQPTAAATQTVGPSGPESAGLVSAAGLYAGTTDANSLQSGLFLPSDLYIPVDPCLPPSLI